MHRPDHDRSNLALRECERFADGVRKVYPARELDSGMLLENLELTGYSEELSVERDDLQLRGISFELVVDRSPGKPKWELFERYTFLG